jgi:carbon-monoxide dehydrogenase small subunit
MFAVQLEGKSIRTVEGLAEDGRLHELQRAFAEHHALQCGYCTPGFLMLAVSYLEKNGNVDEDEIRELVASNLCRCTGYQNIVQAISAAARRLR